MPLKKGRERCWFPLSSVLHNQLSLTWPTLYPMNAKGIRDTPNVPQRASSFSFGRVCCSEDEGHELGLNILKFAVLVVFLVSFLLFSFNYRVLLTMLCWDVLFHSVAPNFDGPISVYDSHVYYYCWLYDVLHVTLLNWSRVPPWLCQISHRSLRQA